MHLPDNVHHLHTADLSTYWPNFTPIAYAVYDDESVYLFHHPEFDKNSYAIIPLNESFAGNTLIEFQGYPTAIVNRNDVQEDDALVATLIHELFHGHQQQVGESRFPDEVQGIFYPLLIENAALRARERYHLYHAVVPTDRMARERHLRQFVRCRQERMIALGESMHYELLTETVEGPAFYVESQAYMAESDVLYRDVLAQYGDPLLDVKESIQHLRKSCYSSGLYLCYVLDRIAPDWKEDFLTRDTTLFALVQELVVLKDVEMEPVEVTDELRAVIDQVQEERRTAFDTAVQGATSRLTLKGDFQIAGIDPMNIVADAQRALHLHFVRVKMGESTYLFRHPVISEFKTDLFQSDELTLLLSEPLEVKDGRVFVQGVGLLQGKYDAETKELHMHA